MKNLLKLFGIAALVAVIGFSFVACGNGTTDGDGGDEEFKPVKVTITLQNPSGNTNNLVGIQVMRGNRLEYLRGGPGSNDYDESLQVAPGSAPITFSFTATEGDVMSFYLNTKFGNDDTRYQAYAISRQEIEEQSGGELKITLSFGDSGFLTEVK